MRAPISDVLEGLLKVVRGACVGTLLTLRADTTPSPASRPRVGKFGTYYVPAYAAYMGDCQRQFSAAVQEADRQVLSDGRLVAVVETIVSRPKSTKFDEPRGDVDNFAKAPLDAATKAGVWPDDGALKALITTKRFAATGESPGVVMHIGRLSE